MKAMGMTFGDRENNSYFTFFSPLKQYNITRFQRTYTWGSYQIKGILKDIKYVLENDESVAWPSILIQRSPPRRDDNPNVTYYDVGDGQQRIISVSLGLLALSRIASERRYVEDLDDDLEYLHEFKPDINDPRRREGVLGRVEITGTSRSFHPVVNFFSESSNEAFRSIFNLDDEELRKKIQESIDDNDDFSKLYKAFRIYYTEFRKETYSNSDLRKIADVILNRIHLTVVEYETSENMQRAFANMNSFGIQLTEPELVKAEFYGHFKLSNPGLAERMAKYWTSELESTSWEGELVKTSNFKKVQKTSPLETFLQEYYHSVTNWSSVIKSDHDKTHWLRDSWAKVLHKHDNHEKLWDDFKKAAETFKAAKSKGVFVKNSADWWANYSYNMLSKVIHYPSILIKLRLDMKDDDFIRSLDLLMKYWMYLTFVTQNGHNMHDSMIYPSSRLLNSEKWSYDDLLLTLQEAKAPKLQWRDRWYIQDRLSKSEYDDLMNTKLVELLIYVCNRRHLELGHIDGLYNTRTSVTGAKRSREHILPQTPRTELGEEDRMRYDAYVKRLGNSIILATDENSSASNRSIEEKIQVYRKSDFNPWGTFWNGMFMKNYGDRTEWNFEDISENSKSMADVIATYLTPKMAYSEFRDLLNGNKAGDVFWLKGEGIGDIDFTLTDEGLLYVGTEGVNFGSFNDLKESMSEILGDKRALQLVKFDESLETVEKSITIRNGKVTEDDSSKSIARIKTKVRVICDDFDMVSSSMAAVYLEFVKHFWATQEIAIRQALSSSNLGVHETSKIPESRKHLHTSISPSDSLYTCYPRPTMKNLFKVMADEMGYSLEIIDS